jgi:hypothetical protein
MRFGIAQDPFGYSLPVLRREIEPPMSERLARVRGYHPPVKGDSSIVIVAVDTASKTRRRPFNRDSGKDAFRSLQGCSFRRLFIPTSLLFSVRLQNFR